MNKERRKALEAVQEKITNAQGELESLRDEEQDYADNMPESLQSSEKHDTAEEAIASMDSALDSLSEAANSIDEANQS